MVTIALTLVTAAACGSSGGAGPTAKAGPASEPQTASPSAAPVGTQPIPTEYDEKADAAADVDAALAASRRDGKPVLLDFGGDWCPDCRVLAQLYHRPAVARQLTEDYHLVLVDVGEFDTNLDLAADYVDLHTSGVPALAVVRGGRTLYASNKGEFASARSMKAPGCGRSCPDGRREPRGPAVAGLHAAVPGRLLPG